MSDNREGEVTWALQVWDGQNYRVQASGSDEVMIRGLLRQQTRVMDRCPARLVRCEIVEDFVPKELAFT